MSIYDVFLILFDESSLIEAGAVLVPVLLVYLAAFRGRFQSVLDPLVYVLALSAVALSLLLLMSLHDMVSTGKVAFVLLSLSVFYAGFLGIDSSRSNARSHARRPVFATSRRVSSATLAILFAANFLVLATIYTFFGVPVFLESRLAQFSESGGFGALSRLQTGLEFSALVLAFIGIHGSAAARWWARAILVQFAISALLSGSKGSLLSALFGYYLAAVYRSGSWRLTSKLSGAMLALIGLVIASPLLVIFIQNRESAPSLGDTLQLLVLRIAAEGDPYAYFLGADAIDSIARHDWLAPVRPVLVALRLVSADNLVNPGYEIIREVLGVDNPASGPNSRLPIYLLYFYGFGGIMLAPFLGMALGGMRNLLRKAVRWSPVPFAVAAAIYYNLSKLEVDPQITIAGLFGLGLVMPVVLIAWLAGGVRLKAARSGSRATSSGGGQPVLGRA